MTKTIIGTFNSKQDAENATYKLRNEGFSTEHISIVGGADSNLANDSYENSNTDGITAGAVLGGIAGLLIGASTITVPGLGLIAAAGPIAGTLSGAVAGGIVGALVDLGVPEHESRFYEDRIKNGMYLVTIKTEVENVDTIKNVVTSYGATDINIY